MKLTAIIISYNEVEYISEAIESCLSQDYQDYEIIIGDDGSNDGSIDLIQRYVKKYPQKISYFVMDRDPNEIIFPSRRVSAIIKRAASLAKGEFLTILSGDDYFCDDSKFSKQLKCFEQDKKHKYSACTSGYNQVWKDGRELPLRNREGLLNSNRIYWAYSYLHISCFIFRKEVFSSPYLLKLFCDDVGLVYSLACMGKWYHIEDITLIYRQRDTSIMHEANQLELFFIELLVLQDCLRVGKMKRYTLARYGPYLHTCLKNHEKLQGEKFDRMMLIASREDYPLVYEVRYYKELSFPKKVRLWFLTIRAEIYHYYYATVNYFMKQWNEPIL